MSARTVSVQISEADLEALYFALDWVHQVLQRNEAAITAAGHGEEATRWMTACERTLRRLLVAEQRLEGPWR